MVSLLFSLPSRGNLLPSFPSSFRVDLNDIFGGKFHGNRGKHSALSGFLSCSSLCSSSRAAAELSCSVSLWLGDGGEGFFVNNRDARGTSSIPTLRAHFASAGIVLTHSPEELVGSCACILINLRGLWVASGCLAINCAYFRSVFQRNEMLRNVSSFVLTNHFLRFFAYGIHSAVV